MNTFTTVYTWFDSSGVFSIQSTTPVCPFLIGQGKNRLDQKKNFKWAEITVRYYYFRREMQLGLYGGVGYTESALYCLR